MNQGIWPEEEVPETTVAATKAEPSQTEPQIDAAAKHRMVWYIAAPVGLLGLAFGIGFGVAFRRKKRE